MLIEKDFENALLGKSYLSFALGLGFLEKNQRVLLIDDERVQYGKNFLGDIGENEKEILKVWGQVFGIEHFINIDNYLVNRPYYFHFLKRKLKLGGLPHLNYLELQRKLPEFFNLKNISKSFDENLLAYVARISNQIFNYKTLNNLSLQDFEKTLPKEVLAIAQVFMDYDNKSLLKRNITLMSKYYFHHEFSDHGSKIDIYNLIIHLLSPRYELDIDRLTEDMRILYCSRGGSYKKSSIESWQLDQGKLFHIQLSSFEGVMNPKRVYYLGQFQQGFPFRIISKNKSYRSIICQLPLGNGLTRFSGQYHLFSLIEDFGTDCPFIEVSFKQNFLEAKLIYHNDLGSAPKFYKQEVGTYLKFVMENNFHFDDFSLEGIQFLESFDEYFDGSSTPKDKLQKDEIEIIEYDRPGGGKSLKGIKYMGPLVGHRLGLFSHIMNLKEEIH